ncbi:MAG TPA: copper resistance protein CopC, partial [Acidimicrobiales bacterium]|nr:copper resistance protein CopC [Acidimicrobiales bacterium]
MTGRPTGNHLRLSLIGVIALASIVTMAARADAHALLTSSDPPAGATLARSPTQVIITFSEQPDPNLSTIKVLDSSGQVHAGGHPQPVAGQAATMRIAVPNLANGVYTVTWQTVSKVDGHLAGGAYAFGVGVSPAGATLPKTAVPRTPRPSTVAVVSRWAYLVGLIGLLGLSFTEVVLAPGESAWPRLRRGLVVAWLLAALGAAGITQTQRISAHVRLDHVLASSLGHSLKVRAVPLLLAGALLGVVLVRRRARRRASVALVGAAGLGAMLADVTVGHPAAVHGWEWFRVGTQWAHIAAVGLWVGGLAGLLLILGAVSAERRGPLARRFSLVAGIALLAVLATGTLRALDEVGTWHGLFSTGFGQLIIVKITLLGVLALLGAINRYRNVPTATARPHGLRRV